MAVTTLCAVLAALQVLPNRSQFFQYEEVSVSCGRWGRAAGWTVKRNTSSGTNLDCPSSRRNQSDCFIKDLYPADGGVYWCESAAGECSTTAFTIAVTDGPVVLDSPVLPVKEGHPVTLRCRSGSGSGSRSGSRSRSRSSSNQTADFYKDDLLIGSSSTAELTIHRVSRSDEGLYRCRTPDGAESPPSRLTVSGASPPPDFPLVNVLVPVVGVVFSLPVVVLIWLWWNRKGKVDADDPYTDVAVVPEVAAPKRLRAVDDTESFYSTLSLNHM